MWKVKEDGHCTRIALHDDHAWLTLLLNRTSSGTTWTLNLQEYDTDILSNIHDPILQVNVVISWSLESSSI